MIYTITLNPAMDLHIFLQENVKNGRINRSKEDKKYAGGKGINISRVLTRIGTDNVATGFLGGFTGEFIKDKLDEEKVPHCFTTILEDTRINIKQIGKNVTEIKGIGPAILGGNVVDFMDYFHRLTSKDIVILAGSSPKDLGNNFYGQIIQKVKQAKAEFVMDLEGKMLLDYCKYQPLLVKPNLEELNEIFDTHATTLKEITPLARKLLDAGSQNVIVSLGNEGALFINHDLSYFAPVIDGKVVNASKAGDSLVAGFVSKYSETKDVTEAFKEGIACATSTAFSEELAWLPEIYEMRKKVVLEELPV